MSNTPPPVRSVYVDLEFMGLYKIKFAEAAIYSYMLYAGSYLDRITHEGKEYLFLSRNLVAKRLKNITDVPDTIYRYYRGLDKKGVVIYAKIDGKDCIHIIPKIAMQWNSDKRPNEPKELGQTSENTRTNVRIDSDKRPTYRRDNIIEEGIDRESTLKISNSGNPAPPEKETQSDDPRNKYREFSMNDFISDDPEAAYKSIYRRVKAYHEDYQGTGRRVCEAAKNMLAPAHYSELLETWIRTNSVHADFFTDPVSRLMRGRSNLVSWVKREKPKPAEASKDIDVQGYDSPIMREKRDRAAAAIKKSLKVA